MPREGREGSLAREDRERERDSLVASGRSTGSLLRESANPVEEEEKEEERDREG